MTIGSYPKAQCPLATVGNVISGLCHMILYFIACLTSALCLGLSNLFRQASLLSHSFACSCLL